MSDRIDRLVDATLATGAIPAGATAAERAEVERLVATASSLHSSASVVDAEARSTMPNARARFERYMAARPAEHPRARAPQTRRSSSGGGVFSWFFASGARMAIVRGAAVVAVVAALGLFLTQSLDSGVQTASAQVLEEGNYVQIEGTVAGESTVNGVRYVHVISELGEVDIALSADTSVVSDDAAQDVSAIKPGERILIGGVVEKNRKIGAQTLALARPPAGATGETISAKKLQKAGAKSLEGSIVTLALTSDGKFGQVVLDDGKGGRFVARITRQAAETLLLHSGTALGTKVKLTEGTTAGLFALSIASTPAPVSPAGPAPAQFGVTPQAPPATATQRPTSAASPAASTTRPASAQPGSPSAPATRPATPTQPGAVGTRGATPRPAFVEVRGVITGRNGNTLTVQTAKGPVQVVVRPATRLLPGDTGLTTDAIVKNAASPIGFTIGASGGVDGKTGQVLADVIVLGPKGN